MLAVLPVVTQAADLCFGVIEGTLIKADWSTLAVRKLASCSAYAMSAIGLVVFAYAKTARVATVGYCLAHAIPMPAHFGSGFGQCYREVGGESSGSLAALCTRTAVLLGITSNVSITTIAQGQRGKLQAVLTTIMLCCT